VKTLSVDVFNWAGFVEGVWPGKRKGCVRDGVYVSPLSTAQFVGSDVILFSGPCDVIESRLLIEPIATRLRLMLSPISGAVSFASNARNIR
jgi:hypothetical protein